MFITFKLYKWYQIAQSIRCVKFVMLPPDVVLTCKFPSDSVGIMSCSSSLLLVFFESCHVKLKIRYQASIKTLLYENSYENLVDWANSDEKTNVNKLVKVVFKDILRWCFFTKCCIFTFVFMFFDTSWQRLKNVTRESLRSAEQRRMYLEQCQISQKDLFAKIVTG